MCIIRVKKVAKKHSLKFEIHDFREKSAYFAKENTIFKFLLKFTHFGYVRVL